MHEYIKYIPQNVAVYYNQLSDVRFSYLKRVHKKKILWINMKMYTQTCIDTYSCQFEKKRKNVTQNKKKPNKRMKNQPKICIAENDLRRCSNRISRSESKRHERREKKKRNNRVKNSGVAYVCTRPYVCTYETNDKRYSLYWI